MRKLVMMHSIRKVNFIIPPIIIIIVVNAFDYYAEIYNHVDGGFEFNYTSPTNVNNLTNKVDGSKIKTMVP